MNTIYVARPVWGLVSPSINILSISLSLKSGRFGSAWYGASYISCHSARDSVVPCFGIFIQLRWPSYVHTKQIAPRLFSFNLDGTVGSVDFVKLVLLKSFLVIISEVFLTRRLQFSFLAWYQYDTYLNFFIFWLQWFITLLPWRRRTRATFDLHILKQINRFGWDGSHLNV